jgi:EAL domain-containing protein (putative c-di-GMP-specific phosphodiesterase class I)
MAQHLGFDVVAEGVETTDQHAFLAARGCEYYQGYYFHRPQLSTEWLADLGDRCNEHECRS